MIFDKTDLLVKKIIESFARHAYTLIGVAIIVYIATGIALATIVINWMYK
jgi:uncharacterized ion transporter superfamily protein YfcC